MTPFTMLIPAAFDVEKQNVPPGKDPELMKPEPPCMPEVETQTGNARLTTP